MTFIHRISDKNRITIFINAVLSAALFGFATPISKLLLSDINPFSLAGFLYFGASLGLFPVILVRKELFQVFKLNRVNAIRLVGAIILGGIGGPILLLSGLASASAASVSLWLNLELVATTLLGCVFFKDYLGVKGWIGVGIALISGVVLTIGEGGSGLVSAVLVCMACVCWGFDNHFMAMIDGISAVQSTFIKGLCAGIINSIIGYLFFHPAFSGAFALYAMLLGSISYGLSLVLYVISSQKLGAIRSQIIFSSAPFFGVFLSIMVLHETINALQIMSFALLIISIALMAIEKHQHSHTHYRHEHIHFHGHDDSHHDHAHTVKHKHHEHAHEHEADEHSHPHWPDIHHRHEHE